MVDELRLQSWVFDTAIFLHMATLDETGRMPDAGVLLLVPFKAFKALSLKMFRGFHFLQSDMVFGIIYLFSWIFSAVSSEKSCPTAVTFLLTYIDVRAVQFFAPS